MANTHEAMEPKIRIEIDNKEDLELFEFANAMSAFNSQYYSLLNSSDKKNIKSTHKLYVRKLTHGSIIVDLCEKAPVLLPIVTPFLGEFYAYIAGVLNYLTGKIKYLPYHLSKMDWNDFKKILEPIANISGNNISFIPINLNINSTAHTYNSIEAAAAQNKCDREIKQAELGAGLLIKENVELQLYQARNSNLTKSTQGNLGIIPEINDKPKVLTFASEKIRYNITKAEENPFHFIYKIDVEVKLKNEKIDYADHKNIKEYEILKLHGVVEKEQSDIFADQTLYV